MLTLIQLFSRFVQDLFHFLQRAPRGNSLYEILVVCRTVKNNSFRTVVKLLSFTESGVCECDAEHIAYRFTRIQVCCIDTHGAEKKASETRVR